MLFRNLWRKERKGCVNFCGFIELSHDCIPIGLFFLFSSQFVSSFCSFHFNSLVCSKYSESFYNPSVQENFCFETERVYHCDITKVAFPRAVISQSDGSAQWLLYVLIVYVGWLKVIWGQGWEKRMLSDIFIKQHVNWKKETSIAAVCYQTLIPTLGEKKKVVLFVIIEMTCVFSLARAYFFQISLQMKW